jgi:hypothetical protein
VERRRAGQVPCARLWLQRHLRAAHLAAGDPGEQQQHCPSAHPESLSAARSTGALGACAWFRACNQRWHGAFTKHVDGRASQLEMSQEERAGFVQYVTSVPRLPCGGLAALPHGGITVDKSTVRGSVPTSPLFPRPPTPGTRDSCFTEVCVAGWRAEQRGPGRVQALAHCAHLYTPAAAARVPQQADAALVPDGGTATQPGLR